MKHLFFVDDQPEILHGLRLSLRRRRSEWAMSFFTSGREALEALETEPCDLIVSDLMMPEMDGGRLLSEVKRRRPEILRLVLSGFADKALALQAAAVAHQYLSKPCPAAEIEKTLEQCLEFQERICVANLGRTVLGLSGLPASPRAYLRMREALTRPDPDLSEAAAAVEQSAGAAVRFLQIVNSSYFALPRRVASVREAIVYLGSNTSRSIALSAELFQSCSQAGLPSEWLERLERHSLGVARLASSYAGDADQKERLFLAGLLHDVGKIALAAGDSARPFDLDRHSGPDSLAQEKEDLGADHAEVGGCLLAAWGLPEGLVATVRRHHSPDERKADEDTDEAIVHVADALAHQIEGHEIAPAQGFAGALERLRERARGVLAEGALPLHG